MTSSEAQSPRLPPYDEEAEAALLGSFMVGATEPTLDVLSTHRHLGRYFYDLRHQLIFESINELLQAGEPADVITVKGQLEKRGRLADAGGLVYLSTLPDRTPSGWNAPFYADQLKELFIKRRAIAAGVKVVEAGYNGVTTVELMELVERELNGISFENSPEDPNMRELVLGCIADIEASLESKGQPMGITTGLCDLDRLTHGLRPGQVFVVGARPSVGKTSLAANIAEHVAVDCKTSVGFIELEMTSKELGLRLIASRSGVPLDRLLTGDLNDENFRQITLAAGVISKAPLHISDGGDLTISQLRAKARRLHRKHNLSLLIIDYIQLIRPSRANASRNVEVSEVSSSIKALAKELHLPVIALSQLNRDSDTDNRPPRLRDLRDSGSIEQDADIVGLLHRPKPDEQIVTLDIAKHRQGPKRKLNLIFFGETFRFRIAETRCG